MPLDCIMVAAVATRGTGTAGTVGGTRAVGAVGGTAQHMVS